LFRAPHRCTRFALLVSFSSSLTHVRLCFAHHTAALALLCWSLFASNLTLVRLCFAHHTAAFAWPLFASNLTMYVASPDATQFPLQIRIESITTSAPPLLTMDLPKQFVSVSLVYAGAVIATESTEPLAGVASNAWLRLPRLSRIPSETIILFTLYEAVRKRGISSLISDASESVAVGHAYFALTDAAGRLQTGTSSSKHTHTHTHTHTHNTRTHSNSHTYTHAHTHSHSHTRSFTPHAHSHHTHTRLATGPRSLRLFTGVGTPARRDVCHDEKATVLRFIINPSSIPIVYSSFPVDWLINPLPIPTTLPAMSFVQADVSNQVNPLYVTGPEKRLAAWKSRSVASVEHVGHILHGCDFCDPDQRREACECVSVCVSLCVCVCVCASFLFATD
jgi:hypothetical protein